MCLSSFAASLLEDGPIKPRGTGSCEYSHKERLPPAQTSGVVRLSSLFQRLRKLPLCASTFRTRELEGSSQDHLFGVLASALFRRKIMKAGLHFDAHSDSKFTLANCTSQFAGRAAQRKQPPCSLTFTLSVHLSCTSDQIDPTEISAQSQDFP